MWAYHMTVQSYDSPTSGAEYALGPDVVPWGWQRGQMRSRRGTWEKRPDSSVAQCVPVRICATVER